MIKTAWFDSLPVQQTDCRNMGLCLYRITQRRRKAIMNCHKCNMTIPDESRYCMYCGIFLKIPEKKEIEDGEIDWENRILCSDGTCTGTIVDRKCTVCGTPSAGDRGSN
jgi:hypothetical protein